MRGLIRASAYVILLVFLATSVFAVSQIDVTPVSNQIDFGELATYRATITNQLAGPQTYSIYYLLGGLDWQVTTRPASDRVFTLEGGQTKVVEITVRPLKDFGTGIYGVSPIIVETDQGELYKFTLRLQLGRPTPRQYIPDVKVEVDMDATLDPREPQSVQVLLENLNPLSYESLILRTTSDIEGFDTEQQLSLAGLESKTLNVALTPSPYQQPKEYNIFFTLERPDGEIVKIAQKRVTVVSLDIPFVVASDASSSLLKTTATLVVSNEGNMITTQGVKQQLGFVRRLFTKSTPAGTPFKDETGRGLAWQVRLAPQEQASIQYVTSYRLPVALLFVVVLLGVLYVVYRNEVSVTKSASNVTFHEGGVAGLRTTLAVRNLSGKPMRDVEVIDTVPGIADVEKELEMGTLRPTAVRHKRNSIEITWKLAELEPKEERLINYRIKSKLNILGSFTLPRAKVRYVTQKGKSRQSFSNTYAIGKVESE